MKTRNLSTTASVAVIIIVILALGGWVANVVELFSIASDGITSMFVLRVVGVFAAPLGAVLGYF